MFVIGLRRPRSVAAEAICKEENMAVDGFELMNRLGVRYLPL